MLLGLAIISYIILVFLLTSVGYVTFGCFGYFYHDILKWPIPKKDYVISDGVSLCGVCKYCDKVIQQDSQGYWFQINNI